MSVYVSAYATVVAFMLSASFLQGGVITDWNITLTPSGDEHYDLAVSQDEARSDFTSTIVGLNEAWLSVDTYLLDEASDWYMTSYGDVFDEQAVDNEEFPCLIRHTPEFEQNSQNVGYGDFYLAVNTGQGFDGTGEPVRDVYGWVHLRNDGGGSVSMVGNAVSYGGYGIIVGTDIVPEPSTYILFALGGLTIAIAARRRIRKKE